MTDFGPAQMDVNTCVDLFSLSKAGQGVRHLPTWSGLSEQIPKLQTPCVSSVHGSARQSSSSNNRCAEKRAHVNSKAC